MPKSPLYFDITPLFVATLDVLVEFGLVGPPEEVWLILEAVGVFESDYAGLGSAVSRRKNRFLQCRLASECHCISRTKFRRLKAI